MKRLCMLLMSIFVIGIVLSVVSCGDQLAVDQDSDIDGDDDGYPKPLGTNFDLFSADNNGANIVFYISVALNAMDTSIDSPTPSATVNAIEYTPCTITISNSTDGKTHTYTDTKIRYKGNTTFSKPKKQFKLRFLKSHKFYGNRRINIHSEWKDATLMREKLVYDFFSNANVVAPRANHVRVYLKDTSGSSGFAYQGLYTAIENIDNIFINRWYTKASNDGNLYKGYWGQKGSSGGGFATLQTVGGGSESEYRGGNGWAKGGTARAYRLRANEDLYMENYTDLANFISVLNNSGDLKTEFGAIFDVNGFLDWLAANTLVGGWDNYWYNQQNYYLYNINNQTNWKWIAWDYDNSLGNNFKYYDGFYISTEDIYYSLHTDNVLISKILSIAEWKTYYTNRLQYLIDNHFNSTVMDAKIDALKTKIQTFALADTKKQYSDSDWTGNIENTIIIDSDENGVWGNYAHHLGIKDYISQRVNSVQSQLDNNTASDTVVIFRFDPTGTPTSVGVRGDTTPLDWDPGVGMYDDGTHGDSTSGDGVYTVGVTFASGINGMVEYKFHTDTGWVPSSGSNLTVTIDNIQLTQTIYLYTE